MPTVTRYGPDRSLGLQARPPWLPALRHSRRLRPLAAPAVLRSSSWHLSAGTLVMIVRSLIGAGDSVQARYSHVTAVMRRQLLDGLTERWEAALAGRRAMAPGSPPWPYLMRCCGRKPEMTIKIVSQISPEQGRERVHGSGLAPEKEPLTWAYCGGPNLAE